MSQLDCIDSIYCSWKNGNCVSGPRLKNILSLSSEGGDLIDIEGFNFGIEALGSSETISTSARYSSIAMLHDTNPALMASDENTQGRAWKEYLGIAGDFAANCEGAGLGLSFTNSKPFKMTLRCRTSPGTGRRNSMVIIVDKSIPSVAQSSHHSFWMASESDLISYRDPQIAYWR